MSEVFRTPARDGKNAVIVAERQQTSAVNHAPVFPRNMMKRIRTWTQALIVVQNHPADLTPFKADMAMTKDLRGAANHLGLVLHDHLIIARGGHASFRSPALL